MTHSIGEFMKSVFPSTVDRDGDVFKALLADGAGGGTVEAMFEDLEATRAAWQDTLDAYSLLEEQNEKLWGLVSLLSQSDASEDSVYMARNKMLFAGGRAGRAPWGSVHDVRELFKAFFGIEDVWVIGNCAGIDESLLTDGDFESEQDVWSLNGAEFCRDSAMSGNISVLFEKGGTLRQAVSITEAGAYFINFFLKGSARVRVKNSAGQYWKAIENGTGEWRAGDACWEFSSADWDNHQCFFALEAADAVTIEIEGRSAGSLVDYMRLHLKTATSMFAVIGGYGGGVASTETGAYAPPLAARLNLAAAGRARALIRCDDFTEDDLSLAGSAAAGDRLVSDLMGIDYGMMSYMDSAYILGSSGMTAQEVAASFLELVKPAGVAACAEILVAETEVDTGDEDEDAGGSGDSEDSADSDTGDGEGDEDDDSEGESEGDFDEGAGDDDDDSSSESGDSGAGDDESADSDEGDDGGDSGNEGGGNESDDDEGDSSDEGDGNDEPPDIGGGGAEDDEGGDGDDSADGEGDSGGDGEGDAEGGSENEGEGDSEGDGADREDGDEPDEEEGGSGNGDDDGEGDNEPDEPDDGDGDNNNDNEDNDGDDGENSGNDGSGGDIEGEEEGGNEPDEGDEGEGEPDDGDDGDDGDEGTDKILDDGTWLVYTAEGLLAWNAACQEVMATEGASYVDIGCTLRADVDLAGYEWPPVGSSAVPYTGTFEGNGHSVSSLAVSGELAYAGFFGYLRGEAKDLSLADAAITATAGESGYYYTGAITAYNRGTVSGCSVSGSVSLTREDSSSANLYVGGIVGCGSSSIITGCSCSATITSNGEARAGGIIGRTYLDTITDCFFTGSVEGCYTGGIAGYGDGSTFEGCWNMGSSTVNSASGDWGGILGYARVDDDPYEMRDISITACYNAVGQSTVGHTAGILGYNVCSGDYKAIVTACYSAGDISGRYAGGVLSRERESGNTEVAECYWSGSLSASTAVNASGTEVDGADVTWASAMEAMNAALEGAGSSWRYEANTGSDSETRPLLLADGGGSGADENTD